MAREPQRRNDPAPLGAAIVPVQRALIARAKALEAEAADIGTSLPVDHWVPEAAGVKLAIAAEFRALAEELLHW